MLSVFQLHEMEAIAAELERKSYVVLTLDADTNSMLNVEENLALNSWEDEIIEKFNLPDEVKNSIPYQATSGVMLGYRKDDQREFFETHIDKNGTVSPLYLTAESNSRFINALFSLLNKVSTVIMCSVAKYVGLDPRSILHLSDCNEEFMMKLLNNETDDRLIPPSVAPEELSSSLIRFCCYPKDDDSSANLKNISFDAHTDSSFLTIGICASVPGLEIVDRQLQQWVPVEKILQESNPSKYQVVVFVGEYLQVLTKGRFEAAAHRVCEPEIKTKVRYSCPYIMRGRNKAVIDIHSNRAYNHTCHIGETIADFDGISMKLLHNILDRKRLKCVEEHKDSKDEWILSAYPMKVPT